MIDFHVHIAGNGCCSSGIILSDWFKKRYTFKLLRKIHGISDEDLRTDIDVKWAEKINSYIEKSEHIDRAVLLCLDFVYNQDGTKNEEKNQMIIPNTWGAKLSRENPNRFLYGASVHPYREDALVKLEEAKISGAFLVKWLPSMMGIDPTHEKCISYYKKLYELGLPLLSHTDVEHTFHSIGKGWMQKNHVKHLETALKCGVKVIAAHAGTPRQFKIMCEMMHRYPRFWADTSGLFNPSRARSAIKVFKLAQDDKVLRERLLFGTDWPIPTFPWLLLDKIGLGGIFKVTHCENPFDKDVLLKELLGFSKTQFIYNETQFLSAP